MPHLEDDPLGGDPFDAFDSGDEEIPCGQRDNLAAMFDLAGTLETPVPAQVGEPRAPPLPPAAQTAPVAGPAKAIDLAMLVAALREALPPPQPQAEVAQSLVAISRPCLIRWTLVRCWVRGRALVLPLHPRHRHHLAKRDHGLDPVPDLTPDLVHILLRRRVRAGLR